MKPCQGNHGPKKCGDVSCKSCPQNELPPYSENCPPKYCETSCEGLKGGAREVLKKYSAAVVRIHSQWFFTPDTAPPVAGAVPNVITLNVNGNGFFIDKQAIICPQHLVFAPPNASLAYNQYPFSAGNNTITDVDFKGDKVYPANNILVEVLDVAGSGHSYTYRATIHGYSGFTDLAVLRIDPSDVWNSKLPCIPLCHPHFRFGCSRKTEKGDKVFLIGDVVSRSLYGMNGYGDPMGRTGSHGIVEGIVTDNRHLDYPGYAQPELVVVDARVPWKCAGLPIIDKFGHVIGMQTLSTVSAVPATNNSVNVVKNTTLYVAPVGDGYVGGPSQYHMSKVVRTLMCPVEPCNRPFVEYVETEFFGAFWRYLQSYVGLCWETFTGDMYQNYLAPDGLSVPMNPVNVNPPGPNPNSDPLVIKEVIGLRVRGHVTPGGWNGALPPGGVPIPGTIASQGDMYEPDFGTASPINNASLQTKDKIERNFVITHANNCPLGGLDKQIPISLMLSHVPYGEGIVLVVRSFTAATGYLTPVFARKYDTVKAPLFWDHAWYKYASYPWIEGSVFNTLFDDTLPYISGIGAVGNNQKILTFPVV